MPAEAVAEEVAAVINASLLGRAAPSWGLLSALARACSSLYASLTAAAGARVAPEGAAQQGAAVWQPRPPPNWLLAGGAALKYFLIGLAQKLLPGGWPVNAAMAKRFGLDRLLPACA